MWLTSSCIFRGGAIDFIASTLDTVEDEETRWRLECARQVYLEWSDRHEEALANSRRLLRLPNLTEERKEYLLGREAFNLFQLGRIDEGLARFDQRIAAADEDPKERLRLLSSKAQMTMSALRKRGRLEESIAIWRAYQEATEKGTVHWLTTTALLAHQLQQAGRHEDALRLLKQCLEEDERNEVLLLDAAESHIALGNDEQAKKRIAEARSIVHELARSERVSEQEQAEALEDRIQGLLQRLSAK